MERLSDRAIEIINELHTERLDYNSEYLPLIDAAQKLNDIETVMGDYDLDRLRELVQADREGRYIIMRDAERNGVARLKELSEADREGRCVVLPVKPGETFYTIDRVRTLCHLGYYFDDYDCQGCEEEICDGGLSLEVIKRAGYSRSQVLSFIDDKKKIYLSEQEAESALKTMKEREDDDRA